MESDHNLVPKLLAKVRNWLTHSRIGKSILLLIAPYYVLPEMFKPENRGRNIFVRISGFLSAPITASLLCAAAFKFYVVNVIYLLLDKQNEVTVSAFYEATKNFLYLSPVLIWVLSLVIIYMFSLYSWIHHHVWVNLLHRWNYKTFSVPVTYFIIITSGRVIWFGVFIFFLFFVFLPILIGDTDFMFSVIQAHPYLTIIATAFVVLLQKRKKWINNVSARQMYGSPWASIFVSLSHVVLLAGFFTFLMII